MADFRSTKLKQIRAWIAFDWAGVHPREHRYRADKKSARALRKADRRDARKNIEAQRKGTP